MGDWIGWDGTGDKLCKRRKKKNRYCKNSHETNFSIDTDSIAIGIELCRIPHISEHCPKNTPGLFI